MNNFEFLNPTKIIFGKGTEEKLGSEIKKYGRKVLFHYGGGSIKKYGLYDKIVKQLNKAGLDFIELGGVQPNPRLSLVYEGIELCRKHKVDFVLAVGGGSVIDSAKAIAVGMPYEGDVWDFYENKAVPETMVPVGVVLTLPAAGSESSWSSVITKEEGQLKRPLDHEVLYPKFAILNPETTFTLPGYQTACGAADIMVHIMERYFTMVENVEVTDRLCEATLKTVINNVPKAIIEPDNYAARSEIMWAGTIAHNNLLNTGRIGDWASHMIEHELSGLNDVAHGAGLAVIVPAWMRYVYKNRLDLFVQYAVRVWNVEQSFFDPERTALEGINRLKAFFKGIGLPTSLGEIGITPDQYELIATKCRKFDPEKGTVGNFVPLTNEDIINILRLAE